MEFPLFNENSTFTDDTVLSLAIAKWLMSPNLSLSGIVHSIGNKYINVGFGHSFKMWLRDSNPQPYNSYGNGSAMRVSAIGVISKTINEVMCLSKESAIITHNHPEGIIGAQAVALSVYLSFNGFTKGCIKEFIENRFGYDLSRKINDIRENYTFDSSCKGSVPEAIIAFLESDSVEDAIRLAVSLGGDADTQASISGAISAAYYKNIPDDYIEKVLSKLPSELLDIVNQFNNMEQSPIFTSDYVFIAKEDTQLNSYIRYTFALAVTDSTMIFIPKGTRLLVKWNRNRSEQCLILSNRDIIFGMIEEQLKRTFVNEPIENEEYLCNGINIQISRDDLEKFVVREAHKDGMLELL